MAKPRRKVITSDKLRDVEKRITSEQHTCVIVPLNEMFLRPYISLSLGMKRLLMTTPRKKSDPNIPHSFLGAH
jgi:hypothetical protein